MTRKEIEKILLGAWIAPETDMGDSVIYFERTVTIPEKKVTSARMPQINSSACRPMSTERFSLEMIPPVE